MAGPDFAAVFEALPSPCAVIDRALRYVAVNTAYCRLVGRTREQLLGSPLAMAEGPEEEARLRQVIETGRPEERSSSGLRAATFTYTPLLSADGQVELVLRHAGLGGTGEHANLPGEMLRAWMHELRVPLTVISGYVQLLRLGALAPEMRSRALASVERGVQQQLDLFSDLYAVSDILTGQFTLRREPADLAAVVGAAVEDVRRSAEEDGIPLDVTLASSATTFIDYGRMQWAVRGLLQRALQRAKADGRVTLRIEAREDEVEVAVIDPGSTRTEPRKIDDGRGAWMDLCAHVIEAHGGTIALERDAGGGVAVRLRLPIWKS